MLDSHWSQLLPQENIKITQLEYESFQREYVMYALADKRYGQAFCERFNFRSTLYYFKDKNIADRWIRDNYLQ